jgi:tetratricopeptide (TPR) repeat protein
LTIQQQLAAQKPEVYQRDVAMTLHNLAVLYDQTQRPSDAEQAYQEALTIRRQLATQKPEIYLNSVAKTLHNLGALYQTTQRLSDAERAYQEALTIQQQLAAQNKAAYLPDVAPILHNLAILYSDTQRPSDAERAYQEALTIQQQLAAQNEAAYLPGVARTLTNLGGFYSKQGFLDSVTSEVLLDSKSDHKQKLLYSAKQWFSKSERAYQEALTIRRQLAAQNEAAYLPDVATALNTLGRFYESQNDVSRAHDMVSEAVRIQRDLWRKNAVAFGDALALSLAVEGQILFQQRVEDTEAVCSRWREASQVAISTPLKQSIQRQISQQCK